MKKPAYLLIVSVWMACMTTACAESPDSAPKPESGLVVDLRVVIANGAVQPVDGITSAGQPNEVALKVFADSGYQTIIDIRGEREKRRMNEQQVVESLGMNYITMPVVGAAAINFDNAAKLSELIDNAEGPVLVHCGSGNRVGALLALRESLNGADDAAALKLGKEGGMTRLESTVREVLARK